MTNKIIIKEVRAGQTQQLKTVTPGAGMSGQATVLKAAPGSWYQLSDVVTYTGPKRVLTKRVGKDLHLSLPGGDVTMPDVVIEGYFDVPGTKLQGLNPLGELQTYDTAGLSPSSAAQAADGTVGAVGDSGSVGSAPGSASIQPTALELGESANSFMGIPLGALGQLTPFQMALGGLGALAVLGAAGGGSGGSSSSTTPALDILKAYTDSTATPSTSGGAKSGVTTPTLSTYKDLGVKLFKSLDDTSDASRVDLVDTSGKATAGSPITDAILNNAIDTLAGSALSKERVQQMVDAWYRILKEADGSATINTDVYADTTNDGDRAAALNDPTADDYTAIGALTGSTGKSLALLNDVVGRKAAADVNAVSKVNALAQAAENVMLQAAAATAGASGGPALYTTDAEWANGLKLLLLDANTPAAAAVRGIQATMVTDIKAALKGKDSTAVDTWQELSDLITPIVATHQLRNYSISSSNTAPTLQTFKDAGIRSLAQLSDNDASPSAEIDSTTVTTALSITSSQWLDAIKSALDKLDLTATTAQADIKTRVQAMVNSYFRVLSEADGDAKIDVDVHPETTATTDNDPTASDYANIGATVGNTTGSTAALDLLNDALGQTTKDKVNTLDKVNAMAQAAYNVMLAAGGTALTPGSTVPAAYADDTTSSKLQKWVDGLTALGLGGVTVSNVQAIITGIETTADKVPATPNDLTLVDTLDELRAIVGLVRMQAYDLNPALAAAKATTAPTLQDWGALVKAAPGLGDPDPTHRKALNEVDYWKTTNPTNGLNALNSALDAKNDSALTAAKLQTMADAYARILNTADGDRTKAVDVSALDASTNKDISITDLINVGVRTVGTIDSPTDTHMGLNFSSTGALVASVIGSLSSDKVDTVAELDALTIIAANVMKLADADTSTIPTYTDTEWVSNLAQLGLTGVTANNIADIKTAIGNNGSTDHVPNVDTYAELQQVVSLARLNAYSAAKAGADTPTLQDYGAIMAAHSGLYSDARSSSGDYLVAYNDAVDRQNGGLTDTAVMDMVTAYNKVLAMADGDRSKTPAAADVPAATDYDKLSLGSTSQLTVSTGAPLTLLNSIIDGMNTSQVNNLSKLVAIDATVDKIIALADGTDNPVPSMDLSRAEIANLGVLGNGQSPTAYSGTTPVISDAAWVKFNTLVDTAATGSITTWSKIQDLLNQALLP